MIKDFTLSFSPPAADVKSPPRLMLRLVYVGLVLMSPITT